MRRTQKALTSIVAVGIFAVGALAQQGADEYHRRHPNLLEAERLTADAAQRIKAAQASNEFDFGGHALQAREHLSEANKQLGMAEQFIRAHPDKK